MKEVYPAFMEQPNGRCPKKLLDVCNSAVQFLLFFDISLAKETNHYFPLVVDKTTVQASPEKTTR